MVGSPAEESVVLAAGTAAEARLRGSNKLTIGDFGLRDHERMMELWKSHGKELHDVAIELAMAMMREDEVWDCVRGLASHLESRPELEPSLEEVKALQAYMDEIKPYMPERHTYEELTQWSKKYGGADTDLP